MVSNKIKQLEKAIRNLEKELEKIVYTNDLSFVYLDISQKAYVVFRSAIHVAYSDSAYTLSDDGLSLAKARCDYTSNKRLPVKGQTIY